MMPVQKLVNQNLIHVSNLLVVSSRRLLNLVRVLKKVFCWSFFQTALVGVELTKRGCYANDNDYFDDGECKEVSMDGNDGTVCVCESDLCNGVEKMVPHVTIFLMTTLYLYLK